MNNRYIVESDTTQCSYETFEEAIQLAIKLSREGSAYILQNDTVLRIFRNGNEVFRKQGT